MKKVKSVQMVHGTEIEFLPADRFKAKLSLNYIIYTYGINDYFYYLFIFIYFLKKNCIYRTFQIHSQFKKIKVYHVMR